MHTLSRIILTPACQRPFYSSVRLLPTGRQQQQCSCYLLAIFVHSHAVQTYSEHFVASFKLLFKRMRITYAQVTVYSCFGVISGILEPLNIK